MSSNNFNGGLRSRRDVRVEPPTNQSHFSHVSATLNFLQIEPNLDKAADLLDRIIRDRDAWRDLGAKAIWIGSDAKEDETIQHYREQMGDAYYTKVVDHASHLKDAASAEAATADAVYAQLQTAIDKSRIDPDAESKAEALMAYLDALPTREWDYMDPATHNDLRLKQNGDFDNQADFQRAVNLPNGFVPDPPPANFRKTVLTFSTARYQSQRVLQRTLDALSVQMVQAQGESSGPEHGEVGSAHSRDAAQQIALEWTQMDQPYQKLQAEARATAWKEKRAAIQDSVGLLNFAAMQQPIDDRIKQDWVTVTDRLTVAEVGLATLFGFTFADYKSIDAAALATRDAIEFINRVTLRDQSVVIPLNIRALMGMDAWNQALQTGQFAFNVNEEGLFASLKSVRLRGVGAVINSPHSGQLWSVKAILPPNTWTRQGDGSVVHFAQTVAQCFLNRVASYDAVRDPDVIGTTSLYNASPYGQWNVTVQPVDPTAADSTKDIQDFRIDLLLAAQSYP